MSPRDLDPERTNATNFVLLNYLSEMGNGEHVISIEPAPRLGDAMLYPPEGGIAVWLPDGRRLTVTPMTPPKHKPPRP